MTNSVERRAHADGVERPYSAASIHNGVVYPCGQIPVDENGDTPTTLEGQVRICLGNLERALISCGSSLNHILQLTVYLADIGDLAAYNVAYLERMEGFALPPRTTVQVAAFRGEKRIELTAIAALASEAGSDHG